MLTIEKFNCIEPGEIFASDIIDNSTEGILMTMNGGKLRWLAKKGYGNDWAIYCHWACRDIKYIEQQGDKVSMQEYIKRCVNCTDEVLNLYRY